MLPLDDLHAEDVLALCLLQTKLDEALRPIELRDHLELERVDAALGLLDLLEQLAHARLDLGSAHHLLHNLFVFSRRLVDSSRRVQPIAAAEYEKVVEK